MDRREYRHASAIRSHVREGRSPTARFWLTAAVLLVSSSLPITGQEVPRVRSGEWIRLSTRPEAQEPDWMVARLHELTPAFLVVEPVGQGVLAVDRMFLTRVERSDGWVSRQRGGVVLGALVGGVVWLALQAANDCTRRCLAAVAVGLGVGSALGAHASGYGWTSIPVDQLERALRPRRLAGVSVALPVLPR